VLNAVASMFAIEGLKNNWMPGNGKIREILLQKCIKMQLKCPKINDLQQISPFDNQRLCRISNKTHRNPYF
jgi:hypothetical protein